MCESAETLGLDMGLLSDAFAAPAASTTAARCFGSVEYPVAAHVPRAAVPDSAR